MCIYPKKDTPPSLSYRPPKYTTTLSNCFRSSTTQVGQWLEDNGLGIYKEVYFIHIFLLTLFSPVFRSLFRVILTVGLSMD